MNYLGMTQTDEPALIEGSSRTRMDLFCSVCRNAIKKADSAVVVYDFDEYDGAPVEYKIVHTNPCERELSRSHPRSITLDEFASRIQSYLKD